MDFDRDQRDAAETAEVETWREPTGAITAELRDAERVRTNQYVAANWGNAGRLRFATRHRQTVRPTV
jgi:hypothetical protein